jgi:hypothetical protein
MTAPPPRRLLSPLFLASAAVLLAAAAGLRPTIAALGGYYGKEPIDLRRPLNELDTTALPSFRFLERETLPLVEIDSLGTDDWISYVFELEDPGDLEVNPVMKLFVTYYSDPRDTIPHTPEVCYRQGGAVVRRIEQIDLEAPDLDPEHPTIPALLLDIEQRDGGDLTILYVLYCNGRVLANRERARLQIALPGDKYTYFSKVEAIAQQSPGAAFEDTVEQCRTLLLESLNVLARDHLPRREDLKRRPTG